MAKAHTTLLLIDAARVLRADLAEPGVNSAPEIYQQPRGGAGVIEAVRAALALSTGCGRNVYVTVDEIWTQTLTLPAVAVGGLTGAELTAALAFEAEPLSGIPSVTAAMGYASPAAKRTDGMNDFVVAAMEAPLRDAIQAAVRKAGGKLRGICSLKDFPARAAGQSESDWIAHGVEELARGLAPVPLIGPAPAKVSPLRYWVLALLLEAAVLAVCFMHWKTVQQDETDTKAELERLRVPLRKQEETRNKNETLKTELKKLDEEIARINGVLESTEQSVAQLRARIPAILKSLAQDKPREIVIQAIRAKESQSLTVEGMSLEAGLADKFATQLEATLGPSGLRVQPLAKAAKGIAPNGGPWEFTLQIAADPNAPHATPAKSSTAQAANANPANPAGRHP